MEKQMFSKFSRASNVFDDKINFRLDGLLDVRRIQHQST